MINRKSFDESETGVLKSVVAGLPVVLPKKEQNNEKDRHRRVRKAQEREFICRQTKTSLSG